MPDREGLTRAASLNPHGFGASVGMDEVFHAMDAESAIAWFMAYRKRRPDEIAMFHARYATGDSPHTLANCQPLVLDDGTILAHNGGLFPVTGDRSDTKVFADLHLPDWDLDRKADRTELANLIGFNKMIILRPGKLPVALNSRLGVWHDGAWHSNTDYTGVSHLRAGQCGACGVAVEDGPYASLCATCQAAYDGRRKILEGGH